MKIIKIFLFAFLACLTISSGMRAQEYEWHFTYPPTDSGKYAYFFHAVDCYGEVCTAVGDKRTPSLSGNNRNILMCFRSTDGGETWGEQDPGLPHEASDLFGSPQSTPQLNLVQQIDSLNAVIAGDSGIIVKTTDGGNTWQRQDLHSIGQVQSVHFSDPMTGIVVKYWGYTPSDSSNIMITHDGGNTWLPSPFCPWLAATMCHSDGGESFRAIGHAEGPVYITHDDWATIDSTPWIIPLADTVHVLSFCNFKGADTVVGYGASWDGNPYMFIDKSTDAGDSWSMPAVPDTLIQYAESMSSLDRDIVFYAGEYSNYHIAVSHDHGMTWEIDGFRMNPDTASPNFTSIAVTGKNEGVGILGYGLSIDPTVLARGVPVSSIVEIPAVTNTSMQAYPNPASGSLIVTSAKAGEQIQLLDVLGREVMNDLIPSNGPLTLDVSSLPAGTYYVSGGHTEVKFVKE